MHYFSRFYRFFYKFLRYPIFFFSKLRNRLVEMSSLGSIIRVWMVFEGTRCLCQPPKFGD